MVSQAVPGPAVDPAVTPDPAAIWSEHIRGAVKEFLKTAVVIDNQPCVQEISSPTAANAAPPTDSGLGDEVSALSEPTAEEAAIAAETEKSRHNLNIRAISDVFASEGVACAFVLPDDKDTETERKISRAVSAAKVSDLVVIDWYLETSSPSLTLRILEELAKADSRENGRLRLICVYTGEPLGDSAILKEVMSKLNAGGVSFNKVEEEKHYAAGDHAIVKIINKSETPAENLPHELISLFSGLADGLVPAFALAAVGAIRKNAHHMLTRFGKILDTAYIANRIITNPPNDVSEMMRELFVSECDSALGLESVADNYLENIAINKWLDAHENEIKAQCHKKIEINKSFIKKVLKAGVKDDDHFNGDEGEGEIALHANSRHLISTALAGSIGNSKKAEHEFARLVVLKREAYGKSKLLGSGGWRPSLTTGTLLKYKKNNQSPAVADSAENTAFEYVICLTPACDTLRLEGPTPFVFLKTNIDQKRYGIVLQDQELTEVRLRLDHGKPFIQTLLFSPDETLQRVFATPDKDGKLEFKFVDCDETEYFWLGEVRYSRATSEMAGLLRNWMRIGVSDSEHLRMTNRGKYPQWP